ncbi:uncharacterized protein LOC123509287 isoform X3 [Portunus trituberculatus]|uniref:uncharacterized protein LOC123509287 isoform X3 n=1 Tax=Portunus trituberculatus TaxID=210409 RepID=UPI001E1CC188|nr:uncharacterized protein LOC123509287 isoform X3 [Portunus trituberculatus]
MPYRNRRLQSSAPPPPTAEEKLEKLNTAMRAVMTDDMRMPARVSWETLPYTAPLGFADTPLYNFYWNTAPVPPPSTLPRTRPSTWLLREGVCIPWRSCWLRAPPQMLKTGTKRPRGMWRTLQDPPPPGVC